MSKNSCLMNGLLPKGAIRHPERGLFVKMSQTLFFTISCSKQRSYLLVYSLIFLTKHFLGKQQGGLTQEAYSSGLRVRLRGRREPATSSPGTEVPCVWLLGCYQCVLYLQPASSRKEEEEQTLSFHRCPFLGVCV